MTNLKLGDRVVASQTLNRVKELGSEWGAKYRWETVEETIDGIIVGIRHLNNGETTRVYESAVWGLSTEYSYMEWKTTGTVPAALIAYNLYRRPKLVPLGAIVQKEKEDES